jgi:hypothetical protein
MKPGLSSKQCDQALNDALALGRYALTPARLDVKANEG